MLSLRAVTYRIFVHLVQAVDVSIEPVVVGDAELLARILDSGDAAAQRGICAAETRCTGASEDNAIRAGAPVQAFLLVQSVDSCLVHCAPAVVIGAAQAVQRPITVLSAVKTTWCSSIILV